MASDFIRIERKLLQSIAFRSLRGKAYIVFCDFMMKRRFQKQSNNGKPYKRSDTWIIINNGEIEYTYSEAVKKGISRSSFMRALDELIEKGFIDIAHSGAGGVKGDKSLYAISERWRYWGTDRFVTASRQSDTREGRGFKVYWEKKKQNIGIKNDNAAITKNDNS